MYSDYVAYPPKLHLPFRLFGHQNNCWNDEAVFIYKQKQGYKRVIKLQLQRRKRKQIQMQNQTIS